jgi:hypothetical protein
VPFVWSAGGALLSDPHRRAQEIAYEPQSAPNGSANVATRVEVLMGAFCEYRDLAGVNLDHKVEAVFRLFWHLEHTMVFIGID